MVVIDREHAAYAVAIIEDCGGPRLGDLVVRMADGLGMHALRITEQAAHQIQIVDRVHRDLDAWQTLQKRPQAPGGRKRKPSVEIHDLAEVPLGDGIL